MVTPHASSRTTRRTYTATTRREASVKLTSPVLAAHASGWRETLLHRVRVSLELKNYDKAQELVGPLPAFDGIAANSPLGAIPRQCVTKMLL